MSRKLPRPVTIRWRDAYAIGATWLHEDEPIPRAVIVSSVGYVIPKARKGYVVLADSVYDTPDGRWYGGVQCIPAGMIIEGP